MAEENEIIQGIDTLLKAYATNTKSLDQVSLELKQNILAKLNHRQFAVINEEIINLFNRYSTAAYSEVVSTFKALIEEFKTQELTALRAPISSSSAHINSNNSGGLKLTLTNLKVGTLIDDRYQLLEKIGFGGVAVVWKALDKIQEEALAPEDQRYVAIKFIDSGLDKDMFANTVREANRTRSLAHENIICIHTVGKTGGLLFIVMELLQGKSLKQFIREKVKQSKTQSCRHDFIIPYALGNNLSRQMIEAIAYAHRTDEHKKGILHLDLKPENIFYNPANDTIKVLDFGLARYAAKEDDEKTVFKGVEGLTTNYASPEMLDRYESDDETTGLQILDAGVEDDVYSLACIIYELFSGKRPFGSLNAKQAEEANKQLVPLKFKKKQWQALAKALAFERKNRIANIDIFRNEFFNENFSKKQSRQTVLPKLIASLILIVALFFLLKNNFITVPWSNNYLQPKPPNLKVEIDSLIQKKSIPILKFWTVVNHENRKIIEISKIANKAIEYFTIGDSLNISFLANERINLTLVYIDSQLNMMIEPLSDCCEANKTYDFRNNKTMKIGEPIGTDKIRMLISKSKIDKDWIRLNNTGEIDEIYIRKKLNKYKTKDERYFINGKLDLIISK